MIWAPIVALAILVIGLFLDHPALRYCDAVIPPSAYRIWPVA